MGDFLLAVNKRILTNSRSKLEKYSTYKLMVGHSMSNQHKRNVMQYDYETTPLIYYVVMPYLATYDSFSVPSPQGIPEDF